MADLRAEFHVPDLWFDFYARLIPGAVFVVAARGLLWKEWSVPGAWESTALLACGYVIAFVTQPGASRMARWLDCLVMRRSERDLITRARAKLGETSRGMLILDKMHGEATMYIQLALLSVVFASVAAVMRVPGLGWYWAGCGLCVGIGFLWALEVTDRRVKRARSWLEGG